MNLATLECRGIGNCTLLEQRPERNGLVPSVWNLFQRRDSLMRSLAVKELVHRAFTDGFERFFNGKKAGTSLCLVLLTMRGLPETVTTGSDILPRTLKEMHLLE